MKLESTAFANEGIIPVKYTCDGEYFSPPLSWSEVPEGTRSFVLIMDDPDAVAVIGKVFDHWVLYDLPPETRQLAEGLPTEQKLLNGGTHGVTSRRTYGYFSPCPPHGTHRYLFSLFALNRPLGLEPGKTKAEILQAIKGYILAHAKLTGLYKREA